jgi:hypothetical protein
MVSAGARGNTKSQIDTGLGLSTNPAPDEIIYQAYKSILKLNVRQ